MRILLTGKNGQLGRCFQDVLKDTSHELFAYGSTELDIADALQVDRIIQQVRPDVIVNAAAYTAVDKAESDSERAYLVNATGPGLLAEQASALGIPFIHVSTDYVFDGAAVEPYLPSDKTNPQGVYGASKLAGEQAVIDRIEKFIILRTSWVFSEYGNNFVKTMLRLAKERDELNVISDQYGSPTYAGDLAQAILLICDRFNQGESLIWGVYHYSGDTPITWYGFSRVILTKANELGMIKKCPHIRAISTDQFPASVKRPIYSVMNLSTLSLLHLRPKSLYDTIGIVLGKIISNTTLDT